MKNSARWRKSSSAEQAQKVSPDVTSLPGEAVITGNGNVPTGGGGVAKCVQSITDHVHSSLLLGNYAMSVTLLVTAMTMAARVYYVTLDTSKWILHPDEIYQGLEVAHSEVYGYGYRTYEFLAPAKGGNLSLYEQWETERGMAALRSPLYPRFYVLVTWLVGPWAADPYMVWRIAHVLVSSLLPLAAHVLASSLSGSADVGAMSAILVASSVHLNVLGTHTLVHSLLAPALFLGLITLLTLLHATGHGAQAPEYDHAKYDAKSAQHVVKRVSQANLQSLNGTDCHGQSFTEEKDLQSDSLYLDMPRKSLSDEALQNPSDVLQNVGMTVSFISAVDSVCSLCEKLCSKYSLPRTFLLLVLRGQRQHGGRQGKVVHPAHTTNDSTRTSTTPNYDNRAPDVDDSGTADVFVTDTPTTQTVDGGCTSPTKPTKAPSTTSLTRTEGLRVVWWSIIVTLCCYVRPDSLVLVAALGVPVIMSTSGLPALKFSNFSPRLRLVLCAVGGIVGLTVGIVDDFYFYGVGTISPLNWFRFNVLSNATTDFFGIDSLRTYCDELFLRNAGMILLTAMNVVGFPLSFYVASGALKRRLILCKMNLLASVSISLVLFSVQGHKELRFIHHVIVLYLVLTATNVFTFAVTVGRKFGHQAVCRLTAGSVLVLFSLSQCYSFPSPAIDAGSLGSWVFLGGDGLNYHVTRCVTHIARQRDVRGVFFDVNLSQVGGFTMLRHDVPLLTLTFTGYHEYGLSSRVHARRKLWREKTSSSVSLTTSVKISQYFSSRNKGDLALYLVARSEYNYLVMGAKTKFVDVGYQQVFGSGSIKVLKRVGSESEERRLKEVMPSLAIKPRDVVLEKEAEFLHAFGLTDLAANRYKRALDRKRKTIVQGHKHI